MVLKQFLVEIDIDKRFSVAELEHMLGEELDNHCDYAWIDLSVKEFKPNEI